MRSENLSSAGTLEVSLLLLFNKPVELCNTFPRKRLVLLLFIMGYTSAITETLIYNILLPLRVAVALRKKIIHENNLNCNWTEFLFLFCTAGWVEKETYYWSTERLRSKPLPLISSPCHFIPKTRLQTPRPIKDKNSFEAIFITTAPKIKNSRSTFTTFYTDPPSFLPSPMILFACVLSLLCT